MSTASPPPAGTKDLSRAVAFLTLERVQQTSDDAKTAFLAGKGFTNDEIAEAKRQAEEVLQKKHSTGSKSSGGQTFGGAAAAAPSTTIAHVVTEPGAKASTRVTLGGGSITFVSLASGPDDGITTPQAHVKTLLERLESTLAGAAATTPAAGGTGAAGVAVPGARGKADIAVIYISVQGLEKYEEEIHEALDGWVDAQAPPTRFLIEQQTGKRNAAQLMAVVRG